MTSRTTLILVCVSAVFLALILLAAAAYRIPWTDEGNFSSAAYNLSHHGFFGTTTLDEEASGLPHIRERTYWVMPLYLLLEAAWMLVVPAEIFWLRVPTVIMVFVVAWLWYRIVNELTKNRAVALLAAMLLPFEYNVMYAGTWARPDMLCLLFGVAAIDRYLRYRTSDLNKALVYSNACLALSALCHPNAILHLVALAILVFWLDRSRLTIRSFVLVGATYACLFLPWILYVLQDFGAFRQQMTSNNVDRVAVSINPIQIVWNELVHRYSFVYGLQSEGLLHKAKALPLLCFVLGLALSIFWPAVRRQPGVRLLLFMWTAIFLVQCVFNQKLSIYLIHIVPYYMVFLGAAVVQLPPSARQWAILLVAGSFLIQPFGFLYASKKGNVSAKHAEVAAFVRAHFAQARTINGCSSLVYALRFDSRLVDDYRLGVTTGKRPDVVILDPFYRDLYREMSAKGSPELQRIEERLREYQRVYTAEPFEILVSPEYSGKAMSVRK